MDAHTLYILTAALALGVLVLIVDIALNPELRDELMQLRRRLRLWRLRRLAYSYLQVAEEFEREYHAAYDNARRARERAREYVALAYAEKTFARWDQIPQPVPLPQEPRTERALRLVKTKGDKTQ